MDKPSSSSLLLLSTLMLWMIHNSLPAISNLFPEIRLKNTRISDSIEVKISSLHVLTQCTGLAFFLSAYSLFYISAEGKIRLKNNFIFLLCGFLVTIGFGMHTVCVIVEEQLAQGDKLKPLVDFLHERVSHNMFVSGLYILAFLIMNTEKNCVLLQLKKKNEKDGDLNKLKVVLSYGIVWRAVFMWILPLETGIFFSVFSLRTGTSIITLVFYFLLYCYTVICYRQFTSIGVSFASCCRLCESKMVVFGCFIKAMLIGLPTIFVMLARMAV